MGAFLFVRDALKLAYRGIVEKKTRAILTIVGIAIGPLALVAVTSVVKGYSSYILSQLQSIGQNLIIVAPSQGYKFTERDVDTIAGIEGVADAAPFYMIYGYVREPGGEEKKVTIYATSIELMFNAIKGLSMLEGHKPPPGDVLGAVVGYRVAFSSSGEKLYSIGDPIVLRIHRAEKGRLVEKRVTLIVEGIVERFGGALFLSPDDSILVVLEAGRRIFGLREWTGILVLAENSRLVPIVTRRIKEVYGGAVDVMSFQGIANIVNSVSRAMEFVALATSMSAFAVAIAGIAATMITTVMERYREIGVMKALGFTDAQVTVIVLAEAVVMSLIGGGLGILLGSLGAYILSSKGFTMKGVLMQVTIRARPEITVGLIASTMLVTLLVGMAGGLLPAYRAARIPPAVALRYE